MTPFVDHYIGGVEPPLVDPMSDVIDRAERLAMSLVHLIPDHCPDNGGLMFEGGCGRISAGDVRGLIRACILARRVLR